MSKEECLELLKSSADEAAWTTNCRTIKQQHGGEYPSWWYEEVLKSGLAGRVAAAFGGWNKSLERQA